MEYTYCMRTFDIVDIISDNVIGVLKKQLTKENNMRIYIVLYNYTVIGQKDHAQGRW